MTLKNLGLLAALSAVLLLSGCQSGSQTSTTAESTTSSTQAESTNTSLSSEDLLSGKHTAEIVVKDYGTITVELDADAAPITVTNFVKLVNEGFYDGLTFHRIIDGFMIQGGDPEGTGMGGSDETIKGEFSENGVENPLSHTRGTISMARSQSYDSASSQFFIVHEDSLYLDGQYAAFGSVTDGMDVVDAICENVETEDSNGSVAAANQPVIESIKMLD
ncbi:MAG: peptidylprolyl isomerase [bacterium]|nr:peptidylprolyl isomerase [bacterium]